MPLKVIGAGQGRTGTTSLRKALGILGLNTYHMDELFRCKEPHFITSYYKFKMIFVDSSRASLILTLSFLNKDERIDWKTFFADYDAIVDNPGAFFYRTFMDEFPEAKVILTQRDPEEW